MWWSSWLYDYAMIVLWVLLDIVLLSFCSLLNKLFQKILKKPKDDPGFKMQEDLIWIKNRVNEDVLCIPISTLNDMTLHGCIIEQVHSIVGHFSALKMTEYIQCWYWWCWLEYKVKRYCDFCEPCVQSKGKYRACRGEIGLLGNSYVTMGVHWHGFYWTLSRVWWVWLPLGNYLLFVIYGTPCSNKDYDYRLCKGMALQTPLCAPELPMISSESFLDGMGSLDDFWFDKHLLTNFEVRRIV
jgi:hypothetical protein